MFDFAIEGVRGREIYWSKAPEPELAYIEAVQVWEEQLIRAGALTFECGCCVDAETSRLELIRIALYQNSELVMVYPIDTRVADETLALPG